MEAGNLTIVPPDHFVGVHVAITLAQSSSGPAQGHTHNVPIVAYLGTHTFHKSTEAVSPVVLQQPTSGRADCREFEWFAGIRALVIWAGFKMPSQPKRMSSSAQQRTMSARMAEKFCEVDHLN